MKETKETTARRLEATLRFRDRLAVVMAENGHPHADRLTADNARIRHETKSA